MKNSKKLSAPASVAKPAILVSFVVVVVAAPGLFYQEWRSVVRNAKPT